MQRFVLMLCVLFLAACNGGTPQNARVITHTDEFTNQVILDNVISAAAPYKFDQSRMLYTWQLRSGINKKTHEVTHVLLVYFRYYVDLKYFSSAADDQAHELKVANVYRSGGHCGTAHCERIEKIAITLDSEVLKSHLQTGYRVKVQSKSGEDFILPVSADMIRTQLDAISKYQSSRH
jgi:hypothetical protein